jgi:hypothetical protein
LKKVFLKIQFIVIFIFLGIYFTMLQLLFLEYDLYYIIRVKNFTTIQIFPLLFNIGMVI